MVRLCRLHDSCGAIVPMVPKGGRVRDALGGDGRAAFVMRFARGLTLLVVFYLSMLARG